jgi:hypothetical protein
MEVAGSYLFKPVKSTLLSIRIALWLATLAVSVVVIVKQFWWISVNVNPSTVTQVAQGLRAGIHKVVVLGIREATDLAHKAFSP